MAPIVAALAKIGLPLLSQAVLTKGKEFVESKLDIKIDQLIQTDEGKIKLAQVEADNEEQIRNWIIAIREQEKEYQITQENNISDRWKFDMSSDSWLSKNIRPGVLIYLLAAISIAAGLSAFDIKIQDEYITLFGSLLEGVFYAYFGGRSLEKITGMIATKWNKK